MEGGEPQAVTATLEPAASALAPERGEVWTPGEPIGRYRLVAELGSGGMGVVYVAEDPELDRRVALKLVRPGAHTATQAGLVGEAQAMAKLRHPNVVAVHDVGIDRGRVFVAMELVDGVTLRQWLAAEPRPWRAVVTAFVAAARGLAAAHRAGLVHRDFKPDNALIDRDGTVRVSDFGLARPPDGGGAHDAAGSPPYMAPEQHDGAAVTEAADQFAFAAALWEAVFGALPFAGADVAELAEAKRSGRIVAPPRPAPPRWLIAALRRALAPAPAARFGSLDELVRALDRGLGRRRRALIASTASAGIAIAFAVGALRTPGAVEPCAGAAAEISAIWNPAVRDRTATHLRALGAYAAGEAAPLDRDLARYAGGWAEAHRDACRARMAGEITAPLYERQLACLERSRAALHTVIDVLGSVPDERLSAALISARSLPDASRCRSEALTTAVAPPPPERAGEIQQLAGEIERVRFRTQAGEPDARAAAAAAVAQSERLAYDPLRARAYLVDGLARLADGDTRAAVEALDRAARTALSAGDDVVFVEAYAREIFGIARTDGADLPPGATDALGALPFAAQIAVRLGSSADFARPLLFNNAGYARRAVASDNAGARAWFEKAIAEPRTQRGEIELASAYGNLALAVNQPAQSGALLDRERAVYEHLLGADHLMTLDAELKATIFLSDPARATAALQALQARYRRLHPVAARNQIELCAYQLGWLAEERGDLDAARTAMVEIPDDSSPRAAAARAYRRLLAGEPAQAARAASEAIAATQARWWTQIYAVDAMIVAAEAQVALGRPGDAIASLRRALDVLDGLAAVEPGEDRPRRLARVRGQLAVLEQSRDPRAARDHARDAAAWYRQAGGYDARAEQCEAIARATAGGKLTNPGSR